MKNLTALALILVLLTACSTEHADYQKNLATAQKLFELHAQEALDEQLALWSKDLVLYPPLYGSDTIGFEEVAVMAKGYHDQFENLAFEADSWLPGTSREGQPDGSVRVYGTWTGEHSSTGKSLSLNSYHYFNFDSEGKIVEQGDFFDAGGMINAVYPKNPVVVSLKAQPGQVDQIVALLESDNGLPATRAWPGCMELEMFVNEASDTIWVTSNWDSYDSYAAYLDWRQNDDTLIGELTPFLLNGLEGLQVNQPNSGYRAY